MELIKRIKTIVIVMTKLSDRTPVRPEIKNKKLSEGQEAVYYKPKIHSKTFSSEPRAHLEGQNCLHLLEVMQDFLLQWS